MKSKTTATLLCFFLGGTGAHHYYLGNTKRGLIYSLFVLTLVPSVVALVEFFILASQTENEFHLKYNSAFIDTTDEDGKKLENLGKLHELRTSGAISEEEYKNLRQKHIA